MTGIAHWLPAEKKDSVNLKAWLSTYHIVRQGKITAVVGVAVEWPSIQSARSNSPSGYVGLEPPAEQVVSLPAAL